MDAAQPTEPLVIEPAMTVLDIVSRFRHTEPVFKRYDEMAGVCLCCEALFDPLQEVAGKFGLDLTQLLADLNAAAKADLGEEPARSGS